MPDFTPVPPGSSNLPQPDPPAKAGAAKPVGFTPVAPGEGGGGYSRTMYGKDLDYNTDPGEYRFQLKTNADNQLLRAQDQGPWETLGIKAANFIPNVLTGIGEMAGYIGTFATEYGEDRDYSNSLTELMKSWKDPMGKINPHNQIWRENPGQTFDLTDSAWWIDNVGSLLESASTFAIPAAGIGKLFGSIAKAAAMGGRTALVAADAVAQTGTAATLAYMEGAMSGYQVYEQTYEAQYQKALRSGMDTTQADEHAKLRASEAASTTVQLNTLMNTALNMTALAPLFKKSEDEIMQFLRRKNTQIPGESSAAYRTRITQEATEAGLFKNRHGLSSYGSEAAQEGLEEVNTQYAEAEGRRVGDGKKKNLMAALGNMGAAFNDVTNQEGALNFILGAFGGVAQTVALDNIPIHRVPGSPDGATSKTLVSSRKLNHDNTRRYFDSITEALSHDVGWQEKKTAELGAAIAANDQLGAEIIRKDMFDVLGLHAVQMGLGEQWINTFKEIAATKNTVDQTDLKKQLDDLNQQLAQAQTPEEQAAINEQKNAIVESFDKQVTPAMEKGLARNAQDDSYQKRAAQAIEDIRAYQRMHDDIYARHSSEEEKALGVADYIFHNTANLYRQDRLYADERENLDRARTEADLLFTGASPKAEDAIHRAAVEFQETMELHDRVYARTQEDMTAFKNAIDKGDNTTIDRMLSKYKALGEVGEEQINSMLRMMETRATNARQAMAQAEEKLKASTGFNTWQESHPDKGLKEYMGVLKQKYGYPKAIKEAEASLETLKHTIEWNRAKVRAMTSDTGSVENTINTIKNLKAAADKRNKSIADAHKESEVQKNVERTAAQAHVEMNQSTLTYQERHLIKQIDTLNKFIQDDTLALQKAKTKLAALEGQDTGKWNLLVKAKIQLLLNEIRRASNAIRNWETDKMRILNLIGKNQEAQIELSQTGTLTHETATTVTAVDTKQTEQPKQTEDTKTEQKATTTTTTQAEAVTTEGAPVNKPGDNVVTPPAPEIKTTDPTTETKKDVADPSAALEQIYLANLNRLHADYHPAFDKQKEALVSGMPLEDAEFLAQELISDGLESGNIRRQAVIGILRLLEKYVESLPRTKPSVEEKTENINTETQSTEEQIAADTAQQESGKSAGPVGIPNAEQTTNAPNIIEGKFREHEGKKAVDAAKINMSSLAYEDYINKNGNWAMAGKTLNESLPPDILDPTKLGPGTKVTLALDKEFDDEVRDYGSPNSRKRARYEDFTAENGRVHDVDNVPIKILGPDGKTKGYLPTIKWLEERYPGTHAEGEGYRNVVALIPQYNDDGSEAPPFNNLVYQINVVRGLRQKIAETSQVEMTIKSKGPGSVILNMTKNEDGKYHPVKGIAFSKSKPETSMLPDPNLRLGLINNGVAYDGKNNPIQVNNTDLARFHGAPVAFLPMADGSLTATPLYMPMLTDIPTNAQALASIERALLLYLRAGDAAMQAELDQAFKDTKINFRNSDEVREYIKSQYTYSQSFDDTHTALDPTKTPKFLFNINEPKGQGRAQITLGWQHSGRKAMFAKLVNGKVDPQFMAQLKAGLATRTRTVNYTTGITRGINSSGEFKEVVFNGKEWKTVSYSSYNEYVKSYATTYAYGQNKQGDNFVYSANPAIVLNTDSLKVKLDPKVPISPVLVVEPEAKPSAKAPPVQLSSDELDDLADTLGETSFAMPSITTTITPSENMQPITRELLGNLYTFTPAARRNGKSVEQVYEELLKSGNGVPYLDASHNPFLNCS